MSDSGDSPRPQPSAAAISEHPSEPARVGSEEYVEARRAELQGLAARARELADELDGLMAGPGVRVDPVTTTACGADGGVVVSPAPIARADAASRAQRIAAAARAAASAAYAEAGATSGKKKRRAERELPDYTLGEEIANAVTHGIGVLLGIAALVLLIVKAALDGAEPSYLASAIVFGSTLILEYLASTLYHAIAVPTAKRIFRIIDHSCIYLLIAGSYTPFLLITLEPYGGIAMFVVIWLLAIAGISFEIIGRQRQPRWVTISIYLVMGWLVVFRLPQLVAALDPLALALLVVGGLCYTVGTAFYLMKSIRYMHSVWHLWVLAGSVFQFMVVILFVI